MFIYNYIICWLWFLMVVDAGSYLSTSPVFNHSRIRWRITKTLNDLPLIVYHYCQVFLTKSLSFGILNYKNWWDIFFWLAFVIYENFEKYVFFFSRNPRSFTLTFFFTYLKALNNHLFFFLLNKPESISRKRKKKEFTKMSTFFYVSFNFFILLWFLFFSFLYCFSSFIPN